MTKAVTLLPTLFLLALPFTGTGFNFSLSFPVPVVAEAAPCLVSSRNSCSHYRRGKGIKPVRLSEDFSKGIPLPLPAFNPGLLLPNDYRIKTVVIDPGHGGHDPGCLGGNSQEKHLALAISQRLAKEMQDHYPDLNIILTRDSDIFIPLHERAAVANRNDADLFISIHCNYMPGSSATKGSETYVMGLHTAEHNLKVAKRENAAILLEENYQANYDYDPNSAEGHIMLNMFQSAYLEQSILFAEKVEAHFAMARRKSRGVKQAGFVVLKETTMPSVLVETGFLSNRAEEAYLMTAQGQAVVSNAMLAAFEDYRRHVENSPEARPLANAPVAVPTRVVPVEESQKTRQRPEDNPPPLATGRYLVARSPDASPPAQQYEAPTSQPNRSVNQRPQTEVQPEPAIQSLTPQPSYTTIQRPLLREATLDDLGITLHVQLAASKQPLDTSQPKWDNTGYLIEVVRENGYYKYQAKNFTSLPHAHEAQLSLGSKGFPGTFLVAYRNGARISLEEVRQVIGTP
jgi:N-acetylmuramoyl-L-alanine amidase